MQKIYRPILRIPAVRSTLKAVSDKGTPWADKILDVRAEVGAVRVREIRITGGEGQRTNAFSPFTLQVTA